MFKHFWARIKCLHWWNPSLSSSCALCVRHAECFHYLASITITTSAVCNSHCRLISSCITVVALMTLTGVHWFEGITAFFSDLISGRIFLGGSGSAMWSWERRLCISSSICFSDCLTRCRGCWNNYQPVQHDQVSCYFFTAPLACWCLATLEMSCFAGVSNALGVAAGIT